MTLSPRRRPILSASPPFSSSTAEIVGGYGVTACIVGSALFQRGRDAALEVQEVKRLAGNARYDAR